MAGNSITPGAIANLINPFDALTDVVNKLTSSLDVGVGEITSFVGALNPGLLFGFQQEVRSLLATIGSGLSPMLRSLQTVVGHLAGALQPLFEYLGPVLQRITDALGGAFLFTVNLLVVAFSALTPFIDQFVAGFQSLVKWIIAGVGSFVLLVGGAKALDDIIAGLGRARGLQAAPQDIGVRSLEAISNQLAAGAFGSGEGGARSAEDFLADIIEILRGIQQGRPTWVDQLLAWLTTDMPTSVATAIRDIATGNVTPDPGFRRPGERHEFNASDAWNAFWGR